jgi:EmrB/QacA subfamily drug resistance transporter
MAQSFHVPPVELNIPVAAYLLVLGAFIPVSGWLTDRFGARRTFWWAVCVFTLSSGLCAVTTTLWSLTVTRVLQGAGGAMMVPVGRLVVLRAVDRSDVIRAVAYLTWPGLAAPVIAPAIGGAITTFLSWRWIFLINVPLGVVAMVATLRLVPDMRAAQRRPLDCAGFVLTAMSLLLLVGGVESVTAGHTPPALVVGLLVLGSALFAITVRYLRRRDQPLLHLDVMRYLSFRVMVLGGSLFGMANSAVPFLLPLLFQEAFGWSPFRSGLVIIPIFVANVGIKPFTTPVLRTFGFRTTLVAANLVSFLSLGLCATFTARTPLPIVALLLVPVGLSRSVGFTAYNTIYLADIAPEEMTNSNTLASTVLQIARGLGVALGAISLYAATPIDHAFRISSTGRGPFAIAFVLIAILPLGAAIEAATLHPSAGSTLTAPLKELSKR